MRKELEKEYDTSEDVVKINSIVNDISVCFKNEIIFETNQEILGLRNVCRGILIKIWIGNNFETTEDHKCNKFILQESVIFCNKL